MGVAARFGTTVPGVAEAFFCPLSTPTTTTVSTAVDDGSLEEAARIAADEDPVVHALSSQAVGALPLPTVKSSSSSTTTSMPATDDNTAALVDGVHFEG